ncbi:hypothetical protein QBC34DRAFT_381803 [Podospora aff. communis PSN243]|uniref:Helicase C-terminal domain-containing protein n=1 Tax=Podospora aff. communis PSN243 TaxID=3040156 RepID=A0AAV9GI07_9PEZI|nr:hypothetical protein QBC34DRAFT_381803 [Podospora aff. communis PSN243]
MDTPLPKPFSDYLPMMNPALARELSRRMENQFIQENQRSAADIVQFRNQLKAMDDAALFEFQHDAKLRPGQIIKMRKEKPDEKMIISSHSDSFLDAVAKILEREFRKDETLRVSVGQIDSSPAHLRGRPDDLAQRLNDRSDDLGIILLGSLSAAWHGLNMTGASILVLAHPVWTQDKYDRLVGTIRRLGQTRVTTIVNIAPADGSVEWANIVREMGSIM